MALFAEHGFDNVTTAQIATAAGVAHRTFFRHFPGGKEDVLLADLREPLAEMAAELLSRPPHEDGLTAMRRSIAPMIRTLEGLNDADRLEKRRQILAATPLLRTRILGEMLGGQDALVHLVALRMSVDPVRDLRPALIVGTYMTAIQVAFGAWIQGSDEPIEQLCARTFDTLDHGLRHAVDVAPTDAAIALLRRESEWSVLR
jgi:AcrR family transcriptional regulator